MLLVHEVETPIKRMSSGDEINIWYIIGGVGGGILLLIIIAVVAWKVRLLLFLSRREG